GHLLRAQMNNRYQSNAIHHQPARIRFAEFGHETNLDFLRVALANQIKNVIVSATRCGDDDDIGIDIEQPPQHLRRGAAAEFLFHLREIVHHAAFRAAVQHATDAVTELRVLTEHPQQFACGLGITDNDDPLHADIETQHGQDDYL